MSKVIKLYALDRERADLLIEVSRAMETGLVLTVPTGAKLTETGLHLGSDIEGKVVIPVYVEVHRKYIRLIKQIAQDLIDYD